MRPNRASRGRTLAVLLAIVTLGVWGAVQLRHVVYTRHTPEEVRTAIIAAGVMGSSPAEAGALLKSIRLSGGDRLQVDDYNPQAHHILAGYTSAKRRPFDRFDLNAYVKFDSTLRASKLVVHFSSY